MFLRGLELDATGVLVDFGNVKEAVAVAVKQLDHTDLNGLPAFAVANPTTENLARFLFGELSAKLSDERYRIFRVRVSESPSTAVSYTEDMGS